MAQGQPRLYLICYDIADPKRLVRVHRYLKQLAIPLQYSVFITRATPALLDGYFSDIAHIIDPREDDVRAYPLPGDLHIDFLGRQMLPEGVEIHTESGMLGLLLHPTMTDQWIDRKDELMSGKTG